MNIAIQKTLLQIQNCLPDNGRAGTEELRKMYDLTLRLQSQLLGVIYDMETFSPAARQEPLPRFEKAMAEIEIITPRGANNANVWDTSNRAINVIINNLKGIFFQDDNMEHMAFSVVGSWGEKGVTILRISELDESRQIESIRFCHKNSRSYDESENS